VPAPWKKDANPMNGRHTTYCLWHRGRRGALAHKAVNGCATHAQLRDGALFVLLRARRVPPAVPSAASDHAEVFPARLVHEHLVFGEPLVD